MITAKRVQLLLHAPKLASSFNQLIHISQSNLTAAEKERQGRACAGHDVRRIARSRARRTRLLKSQIDAAAPTANAALPRATAPPIRGVGAQRGGTESGGAQAQGPSARNTQIAPKGPEFERDGAPHRHLHEAARRARRGTHSRNGRAAANRTDHERRTRRAAESDRRARETGGARPVEAGHNATWGDPVAPKPMAPERPTTATEALKGLGDKPGTVVPTLPPQPAKGGPSGPGTIRSSRFAWRRIRRTKGTYLASGHLAVRRRSPRQGCTPDTQRAIFGHAQEPGGRTRLPGSWHNPQPIQPRMKGSQQIESCGAGRPHNITARASASATQKTKAQSLTKTTTADLAQAHGYNRLLKGARSACYAPGTSVPRRRRHHRRARRQREGEDSISTLHRSRHVQAALQEDAQEMGERAEDCHRRRPPRSER